MHRIASLLFVVTLLPLALPGQAAHPTPPTLPQPWAQLLLPRTRRPTPTTAAITAADLRTRLYAFADDSMQGRRSGTAGNVRGVEYIASQVGKFGLLPAGQDGTFFQTIGVPLQTRTFDTTSILTVDGAPLVAWTDFLPRDPGVTLLPLDSTRVVFAGDWADSTTLLPGDQAAGKFVVLTSRTTYPGNPPGIPPRPTVLARFARARGIAVVGLDSIPQAARLQYSEPSTVQPVPGTAPIYMYITQAAAARLLGRPVAGTTPGTPGKLIRGNLHFNVVAAHLATDYPLRNVVALLPGSDPALRGEYVVLGAHNDHIGTTSGGMSDIRQPMAHDSIYIVDHLYRPGGADDPLPQLDAAQQHTVDSILARVRRATGGKSARIDSVFNGADDDGSGSVSLLEIAQYFAAQPVKPRRSLLFIWHVGEEEDLWGSTWFTDHPTVPRDSIVAELNMDMIGRGGARDNTGKDIHGTLLHGGPGYLQVVGSRRLSTELGNLAETVNTQDHHGLHFDYAMDADHHPQDIYCRSDHAEYARYGIPIAFFTTGGHADYHQLTDEPQYIDYGKMAQVDNFIADLARHVANLDHRVVVDHAKPDPNAACVQ